MRGVALVGAACLAVVLACGSVSDTDADGGGAGGDGGLDAGPPALSLTGDFSVVEGDYGVTVARFEVTLNAARDVPVSVHFESLDDEGTATPGLDYTEVFGELTIEPGETSGTIDVEVVTDRRSEPDENFTVIISNPKVDGSPNVASIGNSQSVATIDDDDRGFDFNGDGFADIAVSDHLTTVNDEVDAGQAYVFFGSDPLPATMAPADADVVVSGGPRDVLGTDLTGADVNGDGFDDLIVAVRDGNANTGAVWVFFGSEDPSGAFTESDADVILLGAGDNDDFGVRVASGDVNGDGLADILVASRNNDSGGDDAGAAFVFFGSASLSGTLDESDADASLIGADAGDKFGIAIANAGDFNGDGIEDILVGANGDDDTNSGSGAAFLFFGGTDLSGTIDASDAGVRFPGPADANADMGFSVSGKVDIDGDDLDEVIIAARLNDDAGGGGNDGTVYIYKGRADPSNVLLTSDADITVDAEAGAQFGFSVDGVGDINGDNRGDFVLGERLGTGTAYVFYGSDSLAGDLTPADADVTIAGEQTSDFFGSYTSVGFDADGDGLHDFTVGADNGGGDGGTDDSGAAYLFRGTDNLTAQTATAADLIIEGSGTNQFLGIGLQ